MGKKQKRKIARAFAESVVDKVTIRNLQDSLRTVQSDRDGYKRDTERFRDYAKRLENRYHQELSRFKFIDEILETMSRSFEFKNMPLFQYMRAQTTSIPPTGYRQEFPPIMQQAFIPDITWNCRDIHHPLSPAREMFHQVLSYYLLAYDHGRSEGPHVRNVAPVVYYNCDGASRAYVLPSALTAMPEAEALRIVMREIAPAVLDMFKEIKERG